MAALTKGLEGAEMTEIGLLKAAGAVAFTDGDKSVTNAQVMRRALTYARDFDALIVHHTEDPDLVGEGVMNEGEFAARLGLMGVPRAAETIMLERDMRLVALTGGRYHAALAHLRRKSSTSCAVPRTRLCRSRLSLDQSSHAERKRHRPLPHLLKLAPPLRARGRPGLLVGRDRTGTHRRRHVGPQSAGCGNQTPALRGSGARRHRDRDHAHGGASAGARRAICL